MALLFKAEALCFGNLMSGDRRYAIPVFQRAYSWTSREVGQLIGDLWLGLEEKRDAGDAASNLLLGSVVVVAAPTGEAAGAAWIIDGKQRLTTLTILLAALRDRLGGTVEWINETIWDSAAAMPRLMLDLEEESYFAAQVRRVGAIADPIEPDGDHKGRRGIRECQKAIAEDLSERDDNELVAFAEFLRDQVAFVLISAPDIDSGFKTFLSTNHRGKPLTATDILKAELMSEVPEAMREQRLTQWAGAEKALGSDFKDLPGYLRAVHSKAHSATIRDVMEISRRQGGAAKFLDALLFPLAERLLPILHASHAGSTHSNRINTALRYLNWLKARDWVPPALAFATRYPESTAEYALFLERLERLAFGMQILGTGADRRHTRYRAVIDDLANSELPGSELEALQLSDTEQWTMVLNARSNLYQRSPMTCKLLLKRLSASFPGDTHLGSLADVSVEHVLPRNIGAESPWRQQVPDADQREACCKMLGNLVLIGKQQNKDARNSAFEIKRGIFFPEGQRSPHAITNQIYSQLQWRADDIRMRDAALLQRMVDIWQLKAQAPAKRQRSAAR
jgi:hypothetical protein